MRCLGTFAYSFKVCGDLPSGFGKNMRGDERTDLRVARYGPLTIAHEVWKNVKVVGGVVLRFGRKPFVSL